jgi:hypothetical protein
MIVVTSKNASNVIYYCFGLSVIALRTNAPAIRVLRTKDEAADTKRFISVIVTTRDKVRTPLSTVVGLLRRYYITLNCCCSVYLQ